MSDKPSNPQPRIAEPAERWGSWEDADYWRKQSFLARTPAQRMRWLEEMATLAKRAKVLQSVNDDERRGP